MIPKKLMATITAVPLEMSKPGLPALLVVGGLLAFAPARAQQPAPGVATPPIRVEAPADAAWSSGEDIADSDSGHPYPARTQRAVRDRPHGE
jgi:hypothetical protein